MDKKSDVARKRADKILIKRVRPWVKFSLGMSALAVSYGLARQLGVIKDRETIVRFDLVAIEQ